MFEAEKKASFFHAFSNALFEFEFESEELLCDSKSASGDTTFGVRATSFTRGLLKRERFWEQKMLWHKKTSRNMHVTRCVTFLFGVDTVEGFQKTCMHTHVFQTFSHKRIKYCKNNPCVVLCGCHVTKWFLWHQSLVSIRHSEGFVLSKKELLLHSVSMCGIYG